VTEIGDAFKLLSPTLGDRAASWLFAIALLGSGQNATITGTLAGQIVLEGFMSIRLQPWARRLVARSIAIVPAVVVAAWAGHQGVGYLLLFSQVVLSMQLPFAVIPLMQFVGDRRVMGAAFVVSTPLRVVGWAITVAIVVLNLVLLLLLMVL